MLWIEDRGQIDHVSILAQCNCKPCLHFQSLVQHVTEPTHAAGHTLDLVIAKQDTTIDRVRVAAPISDHSLVVFTLRAKKPATAVQCVTSRAWRRLSMEDFASDLAASKLCTDLDALRWYNSTGQSPLSYSTNTALP